MSAVVHVDDMGTWIATIVDQDDVVVDVSGASAKKLSFKKPDGTTLIKTADFTDDGVDGKIQYTMLAGEVGQAGEWLWQGYVVLGGAEFYSEETRTPVEAYLVDAS